MSELHEYISPVLFWVSLSLSPKLLKTPFVSPQIPELLFFTGLKQTVQNQALFSNLLDM